MRNILALLGFLSMCFISCTPTKSYRDASRESIGIAPMAHEQKEAIFQIYIARAFSWRGHFATHPWIAWKLPDDDSYTVAQVTGWRVRRGLPSLSVEHDLPDRRWFDNEPTIIDEFHGAEAEVIIEQVKKLISDYPFKDIYTLWPGPNSNTFVAYVIREIPELKVELPSHAIGKDYLGPKSFVSLSPSHTGVQLSAFGALGFTIGLREGLELNFLSLNFGFDPWPFALKLPFVGRVGFPQKNIDRNNK
jgi:hypothetical protein